MTQAPDGPCTPPMPSIPPADILRRLAALGRAPAAELKQEWRDLFGQEPPAFSRTYLQSRLAYVTLRRIRADNRPIAGTRLIREYRGLEHVVTVLADGFEYEGRPYRSLSAIARAITGTRWNGWTFFGLYAGGRP